MKKVQWSIRFQGIHVLTIHKKISVKSRTRNRSRLRIFKSLLTLTVILTLTAGILLCKYVHVILIDRLKMWSVYWVTPWWHTLLPRLPMWRHHLLLQTAVIAHHSLRLMPACWPTALQVQAMELSIRGLYQRRKALATRELFFQVFTGIESRCSALRSRWT